MKKSLNKKGFTLIELLLVTVLLFTLAYATFMTIRSTMAVKRSIDNRTETLQSGRALIELLDRDLRNVFFIDANDLGWNDRAVMEALEREGEGGGEEYLEPPPPKPIPVTIFQATRNELLFSSRSHQRMSADSPENEQHFVRYRVQGKELIREESFRAISKDDIGDSKQWREFVLLEELQQIEFSFWNARSQRWDDRWDTNSSENLDSLPPAVKIKVKYTPEVLAEGDDAMRDVEYETIVRLTQHIFKRGPLKHP
jgi:type II secretory pathway component PulJ